MLESGDFVWSCVRHKYSFVKTCHSSILQWRTQDLAVTKATATSEWQHLEMFFLGSTPRLPSVCCLSILRSKRGECHQPTQVGPSPLFTTWDKWCTYKEGILFQKSSVCQKKREIQIREPSTFCFEFLFGSIFPMRRQERAVSAPHSLVGFNDLPQFGAVLNLTISKTSRRASLGLEIRGDRSTDLH